jgi:uncharacterized protein YndB with AHSA1/START domain
MTQSLPWTFDPTLDLVLERVIDVPRELVWRAWTEPEHLKKWFCPVPWTVSACEVDLRPGGIFKTTRRSPEGEDFPQVCIYLDVIPFERLIWTDALIPGYRPGENPFLTGVLLLEPHGQGTRYISAAMHKSPAAREQHKELGFYEGWGTVLDQLIVYIKAGL